MELSPKDAKLSPRDDENNGIISIQKKLLRGVTSKEIVIFIF